MFLPTRGRILATGVASSLPRRQRQAIGAPISIMARYNPFDNSTKERSLRMNFSSSSQPENDDSQEGRELHVPQVKQQNSNHETLRNPQPQRRHPPPFPPRKRRQHPKLTKHIRKLPTTNWIQLYGSLPMTSLEEVLDTIELILREAAENNNGILMNLERSPLVPSQNDTTSSSDDDDHDSDHESEDDDMAQRPEYTRDTNHDPANNNFLYKSDTILRAHVVLSPFGRPNGWNIKLANSYLVQAILSEAKKNKVPGTIQIGWKFATVQEYHPKKKSTKHQRWINHHDTRTMLVVNDSMVRFENCPPELSEVHLRDRLSRYELTPKGNTVIQWRGRTPDGKDPPLTYVVRFASPAYARAAVREMQGNEFWWENERQMKPIKLVQYPKQLL